MSTQLPRPRKIQALIRSCTSSLPVRPLLACVVSLIGSAAVPADTLTPLLAINADDPNFPWMNTGNGVRSAALSKGSGNIVVATDVNTSSPVVRVLSPSDGSELTQLLQSDIDGNPVPGGSFRINQVASGDDGTLYACNLDLTSTAAPRNFRIFRWESDEPDVAFTLAYEGDPAGTNEETGQSLNGQRWGDSFDVMGSGENTLIVAGARALGAVALFTTADGLTFTPHFVPNVGAAAGNLGVAFGQRISNYDDPQTAGVESLEVVTVFAKLTGQSIRRAVIRLDTFALVGAVQTIATVPAAATGIGSLPAKQLLAAVEITNPTAVTGSGNPDRAHVYNYADPSALTASVPPATFAADNPNANVTGDAAFYQPPTGNTRVLAVSSNNTLALYEIVPEVTAPAVSASPANATVIEGGAVSLTVTASGSTPLTYAWTKDGEPLPTATSATLTITNATSANSGSYQVRVSNSAGFVDSTPATLTVVPRVNTDLLTPLWSIAPGVRPYLIDDNNQRSLSYNAARGHLLLLSRTVAAGLPNPAIVVLDAATGEEIKDEDVLRTLDVTGVSGGFFTLNQVGVADDGAVFACNLVLDADGNNFKIYRWQNDDPLQPPVPAFEVTGEPGREALFGALRTGDTFAVTGSGAATRLALGARNLPQFAIFTSEDGENFSAKTFDLAAEGLTGAAFFQICFASESSLWAKAESGVVRLVSFDVTADPPTATVVRTIPTAEFPSAVGPVGFEPTRNFLAGVSIETPDNLRLYDVSSPETATLADQEFFPADNANINRTGAVDFGGGRVYALGSNNGIIALTLAPPPSTTPPSLGAVSLNEAGTQLNVVLTGNAGTAYRVESSLTLLAASWQTVQTVTLASPSQTVEIPLTAGEGTRYYRVVTP